MEEDEIEKLEEGISHLVPWIKEKICESNDNTIRMKADYFLRGIDSRLVDKERNDCVSLYDGEIYNRIRDILSKEGIWVTLGFAVKGNYTAYIMRLLTDKKESIMMQIQELETEINKLKENIETMPVEQWPDDIIEYLGDRIT